MMSLTEKPQRKITSRENREVIQILRHELSSRMAKNPQFSLRSLARILGLSHTLLSLVMNEQRTPSVKFIEKMVEKLALDPSVRERLLSCGNFKAKEVLKKKLSIKDIKYQKLSLDRFALISEWQHYAILSLLEIEDTELSPDFIAKRLNISPLLAKMSLERLFDMNLLELNPSTGRWRQSTEPIIVENSESTAHTRKFQAQLLNKAIESLDTDPIELRDISSITFAMDAKHVGYALKKIRDFRRTLSQELESFGNPNEVYNLTVQIFPSSKRITKKVAP